MVSPFWKSAPPAGGALWSGNQVRSGSGVRAVRHAQLFAAANLLGFPLLYFRQAVPGDAFQIALGFIVGHAGVAEIEHEALVVDGLFDEGELLEHHVGGAPRHQLREVVGGAIDAVLGDEFIYPGVWRLAFLL